MSIIPISPDKVLIHKCEDGTEFHFRYLTGEYRAKFQDAQEALHIKAKPYEDEAEKIAKKQLAELKKSVKAQGKNKVVIPSLERLVAQQSVMLAKKNGAITAADEDRQTAAWVDIFVVGWKIKGVEPKDPDVPASKYFTPVSMTELMEILSNRVQELMGLSVQDQKN